MRRALQVPRQFLTQDATQSRFERFVCRLNVLSESSIDLRLITAATGRMHLLAKPPQHVIVDTDGDPCLPGGRLQDRAALSTRKVVLCFHDSPPYCLRSCGIALRA